MAKAEVSRLASQIELLEIQLTPRKRLLKEKAVSRDEYDVANYSLQARNAELVSSSRMTGTGQFSSSSQAEGG